METPAKDDFFLQISCVSCPLCGDDVDVDTGVTAIEALWLHEYACDGIVICALAA